ncbi:MAG TPA: sugar porter family MFS transporter [Chthoniobacterales bacterium]|nr:sugar porter family MFS transporter [Chthoniobacterales bacterium]
MDTTGEIEKVSQARGSQYFVRVTAATAALGGLLFGFDTGVISGAILFVKEAFRLTPFTEELLVSAALIGAVCGCILSGKVTDSIGRKQTILATAAIFVLGSILSAFATSTGVLITGRVAIGVAIGIASYIAPLYISEIAPPNLRGGLVTLNQLAITVGILLAYVVDAVFAGSGNWRLMFAFGILPAAALGVGIAVLPESPRWLLLHQRKNEALAVLARIRGTREVQAEVDEILGHAEAGAGRFSDLVSPSVLRVLFCGVALALIQQVTGINTVIYYAPTIFQEAGFHSALSSILATAGIGLVNVAMTVVSIPLLDRLGRRPLLLTSLSGMFVSLVALPLGFAIGGGALKWIGVLSLAVYVASFAIGLGPVFWLLISEIFPLRIRGQAASVATMANWLSNFVVSLTFLSLLKSLGDVWTFSLYAALSLAGLWFCFAFVPETKGVPLERIERDLRSGRPLRDLGKSAGAPQTALRA